MYTNLALEKSSNGMWLSLVERLVWDQDAAGSNPVIPTIDQSEMTGLFLFYAGFEPEKVAALNKQSSGLFVASESLSDSESQTACKAQPKQAGILSSRPRPPRNRWSFFVSRPLQSAVFFCCAEILLYAIIKKTLYNEVTI